MSYAKSRRKSSDYRHDKGMRKEKFWNEELDAELNSGQNSVKRKPRHPEGLKGKEIGLWYRDHQKKKAKEKKEVYEEVVLNFEKKELIEKILSQAEELLSECNLSNKNEHFIKNFKNKVTVTFEEKIKQAQDFVLKNDVELDDYLYDMMKKKQESSSKYRKMFYFRQNLPAFKMRKEIIQIIERNQIVIISGETGCGKTTQVVQFVLDDYIMKNKGSLCSIVCTQPRRISAVSVAERVAAERDEKLGDSVGYQIRLESVPPKRKNGCIMFMTTGILLEWLESKPILSGITHLFLDEIHEREIESDLMIALLKYIIPKRPDLKIILMSATLNAIPYSSYFGGVPTIEIPGFMYPVEEIYLERVLELTNFKFIDKKGSPRVGRKMNDADKEFFNYILPHVRDLRSRKLCSQSVFNELSNPKSEELNISLIVEVIRYICMNEDDGAILVFVPGLSHIQEIHKILSNLKFSAPNYLIYPMHSIMPTINQKQVFVKPPPGVRKIIIATSILETSVTIDDVVYVIDSGRMKRPGFDLQLNVSILEPEWETLANANQRKGRAGRTQCGKCYKLFTRARQNIFEHFPVPLIQTVRLENVILQAKMLQLGNVAPFLEKLMNPPDMNAVNLSLQVLCKLNALDREERLTFLGYHLAKLPVDPQSGKMMLMAALFSCVDPIFSIAACLSFKDPFIVPLGKEEEVVKVKHDFACGVKSDHYIYSEVLRAWEEEKRCGDADYFAFKNFLSKGTLSLLSGMKKQLAGILYEMKFLASKNPKDQRSNVNTWNISLIKAIICAGLYPNVAVMTKVSTNVYANHSLKTVDHPSVVFHKKSYCSGIRSFESPFFVYHFKLKTTKISLHDATMVYPMALLFFGEKIQIINENNKKIIQVDDLIKLTMFKESAYLIKKLRWYMDLIIESVISNPKCIDWEKSDKETVILDAVINVMNSNF